MRNGFIEKKCKTCEKIVIRYESSLNKNVFCSRICYFTFRARHKIQRNCNLCGNIFQISEHKIKKGLGKFCSNSCTRRSVRQPDNTRYAINKFGCWIWRGHIDSKGYGKTSIGERSISSHQYFYEKIVGKTPEGLELDHVCRNTACCNPLHMKLVTHQENVLRGNRAGINHEKIIAIHDMLSLDGFKNRFAEVAKAFSISTQVVKNLVC